MSRLEQERLIVRRRGSGTYARKTTTPKAVPPSIAPALADLRVLSASSTARLLQFAPVPTPAHLLQLAPEFGNKSLLVQTTRAIQGKTFSFLTSYVADWVRHKLTRAKLGQHLVQFALENAGIRAAAAEQTLSAVVADGIVADHLNVAGGAPLLAVKRLLRDEKARAIQFDHALYLANVYEPRMALSIDRSSMRLVWELTPGNWTV